MCAFLTQQPVSNNGSAFSQSIVALGPFEIVHGSANNVFPFPDVQIVDAGRYMAVIRTFAKILSTTSPNAYPFYTITFVNGVEVDSFEWYPASSGPTGYIGVSGSTIFTVPANSTVKFGFSSSFTDFDIPANLVDRNNIKIIRID